MSQASKQVSQGIDDLKACQRRMLHFFRARRGLWFTSKQLARYFGLRFGARIHELRKLKVGIVTKRVGATDYLYGWPR